MDHIVSIAAVWNAGAIFVKTILEFRLTSNVFVLEEIEALFPTIYNIVFSIIAFNFCVWFHHFGAEQTPSSRAFQHWSVPYHALFVSKVCSFFSPCIMTGESDPDPATSLQLQLRQWALTEIERSILDLVIPLRDNAVQHEQSLQQESALLRDCGSRLHVNLHREIELLRQLELPKERERLQRLLRGSEMLRATMARREAKIQQEAGQLRAYVSFIHGTSYLITRFEVFPLSAGYTGSGPRNFWFGWMGSSCLPNAFDGLWRIGSNMGNADALTSIAVAGYRRTEGWNARGPWDV